MKLLRIIILILSQHYSKAILDVNLIISYFAGKHLQYGSIYSCHNKIEQYILAKTLATSNLSLSLYNIEHVNFNMSDTNSNIDNPNIIMVLEADCPSINSFLKTASFYNVFTLVHHWLVFLKEDIIEDLFEDILLTISTDLKVAVPDNNISNYDRESIIRWKLYDVYNQAGAHGGSLKIKLYGIYQPAKPLRKLGIGKSLYWERRNMTGVLFNTMVVLPKNYPGTLLEYLESDEDREINTFNRFHSVLIYHIRDFYNFSLKIRETKSWGYKMNNNSFDGMVRALQDKEIEFGMSPLFVKTERWPVVDYGRRTWLLRSAFIFRQPQKAASYVVFLRPFNGLVWSVTVVAVTAIILLMKLSFKFEFSRMKRIMPGFENSWSFVTLFTFGAICQQGGSQNPKSMSCRILVIFVFVFAILLYQFYSASIVSILLMAPAKVIQNLNDLLHSPLYIGVEDVLYNRDYIGKLASNPIVSQLDKKVPHIGNVSFYCDPDIGLKLVARGGYAFHVEVTTAYPIIEATFDEDTICTLDEIQLFFTQQMHQPLQKHSAFRDMLDYVLHRIDESGLMDRQIKHWHARRPACIRSRPPAASVGIDEFYPALSILLIGIIISLIILIIEQIIKRCRDRKEEEQIRKHLLIKVRPMIKR